MKNLLRLMEEFSILGMPPAPTDTASGLDFMPQGDVAPQGEVAPEGEGEYELDADGNPLLDEQGNPIMKVNPLGAAPGAAPPCACDHAEGGLPALPPPAGGVAPGAFPPPAAGGFAPAGASVSQLPPEDEFDFKV